MSRKLTITLLGDGPSDRCLLVILRRLTGEVAGDVVIESHWADLWMADPRPDSLMARVRAASFYYPCDLLFVHRDAEREDWRTRHAEIQRATRSPGQVSWVAVIPVRMTEAWLLHDEAAIRTAADCPGGTAHLRLPRRPESAENDPDPKETLRRALLAASEKRGRRKARFEANLPQRVQRVAELMTRYGSLEHLPSYRRLRSDVVTALEKLDFSRIVDD